MTKTGIMLNINILLQLPILIISTENRCKQINLWTVIKPMELVASLENKSLKLLPLLSKYLCKWMCHLHSKRAAWQCWVTSKCILNQFCSFHTKNSFMTTLNVLLVPMEMKRRLVCFSVLMHLGDVL